MTDKPDDDIDVVLAMRVEESAPMTRVPGWTTGQCCQCGEDVILSPSTQTFLATHQGRVEVRCVCCLPPVETITGEFQAVPGSRPEFVQWLKDELDRVRKAPLN